MRKFLKILLSIIILILIILIIGIAIITNTVNPNTYKGYINRYLSETTHYPVKIEGDLHWLFFPSLGIRVNDLILGATEKNKALAIVDEAELRIKLFPLFQKIITIDHIKLKGLKLSLRTQLNGENNWAAPLALLQPPPSLTQPKNEKKFNIESSSLESFDILDSKVELIDSKKNQKISMTELQIHGQKISSTKPFPITATFNLQQTNPSFNANNVVFYSRVTLNSTDQIYSLKNLKVTANIFAPKMSQPLSFKLETDASVNENKHTFSIKPIAVQLDTLQAKGEISGTKLDEAPTIVGLVNIPSFDLRQFLTRIGSTLPSSQNPSALKNVGAQFRFGSLPNYVKINPIQMNLDSSTIGGSIIINDITNQKTTFDITLDQITLSDYLPFSPNSKTIKINSMRFRGDVQPNTNAMKQSKIHAGVAIGELTLAKTKISNSVSGIDSQDAIFKFSPLTGSLYQGQFNGSFTINQQQDAPRYSIKENFTNIQIAPLLEDIKELTPINLTGVANFDTDVSMQGDDAQSMRSSLNGTTKITVNNGVWKGLDLSYLVNWGASILSKQPAPTASNTNETKFNSLTGTVTFANGVASNNDLILQAPDIQAKGNGTANLANEQLDYQISIAKFDATKNQPTNFVIPILITGTFSNPSIRPDVQALLKQQVQKQLKHQIDKYIDKETGEQINEQLKKLNIDKIFQ